MQRLLPEGLLLEVPRILQCRQRIVRRRPADRASHDALSEITTLEAIRAEPFSAREFDQPTPLRLWREHESRPVLADAVDQLLSVSFASTLTQV